MKILEYIEQTSHDFEQAGLSYGHGTTNAFDEAVWLTLWKLNLPLENLDGVSQQELTTEELASLNALMHQRISSRLPAAYLTQEAWLQGVPFYIDQRAIIPRSLIAEILAQGLIDPWLEHALASRQSTQPHILDICTGNGSLAILCAMAWPDANVCATDISSDALDIARINLKKHNLENRITLIQSDALASPDIKKQAPYDLIICNPPYVNTQSMQALPAEYLAEPSLALAGGADGMTFIRPLLPLLADYLSENGFLVLEIGHERPYFEAAFPGLEALWLETSAGEDQVVLITQKSLRHTFETTAPPSA